MKYFTEEQLAREIRPLPDVALEALEAGQIERLFHLLNEMSVGHKELDALGLQWISRMFGKIRSDIGEGFLDEILAESASFLMAPYAEGFRKGDEKETFLEIVEILKSSVGTNLVPLGENDDQVIWSLSPCGSGGRILLRGGRNSCRTSFLPVPTAPRSIAGAARLCSRHSTWRLERRSGRPGSARRSPVPVRCAFPSEARRGEDCSNPTSSTGSGKLARG